MRAHNGCENGHCAAENSFQNAGANGHAEPAEIWKARNFIHENFGEELSLARVAQFVNLSPNYLSEKFKDVTGINFVDYVARTRHAKAVSLLHNLNHRVSEVAFAAGFQSLSQFNRVFKSLAGKSPTEYRATAVLKQTRHELPNLGRKSA